MLLSLVVRASCSCAAWRALSASSWSSIRAERWRSGVAPSRPVASASCSRRPQHSPLSLSTSSACCRTRRSPDATDPSSLATVAQYSPSRRPISFRSASSRSLSARSAASSSSTCWRASPAPPSSSRCCSGSPPSGCAPAACCCSAAPLLLSAPAASCVQASCCCGGCRRFSRAAAFLAAMWSASHASSSTATTSLLKSTWLELDAWGITSSHSIAYATSWTGLSTSTRGSSAHCSSIATTPRLSLRLVKSLYTSRPAAISLSFGGLGQSDFKPCNSPGRLDDP
ncbi:MAG: hypothetical protein J3K34DRAFT_440754 [Monoraphidium minutum]|nr:MAG: hypothetical protein J3K34DRAFT_440754 [Monoraphidium minutum]